MPSRPESDLVLAVMVAGCVSSGTKVTQQQAAAFEVGKTTEAQVLAALGAPNQTSTLSDGTRKDIYMHVSAHANAASYIPIVGLFAGGAKGTNDTATSTFTPDGVLMSTSSSSGQTSVNTGLANQHQLPCLLAGRPFLCLCGDRTNIGQTPDKHISYRRELEGGKCSGQFLSTSP